MMELTHQDVLELFAVGSAVSASIALIVEKLLAPYLRMLVEPWRGISLRFVPVLLGIILTVVLFPVAVLMLTQIDHEWATWRITVPLGVIAGAGASYAYELWQGVARALLERFSASE